MDIRVVEEVGAGHGGSVFFCVCVGVKGCLSLDSQPCLWNCKV